MNNKALIIFDWDDTLFPTYWLLNQGIKLSNILDIRKYSVYFKELDSTIFKLLKTSLTIGKVIIITNANIEWISLSKKILPATSELIDLYIPIISARDMYHQIYNIDEWKIRAFKNNIYANVQSANHIISIGDAKYEYDALVSLKKYAKKGTFLKTIKFVSNPTFDILLDQMEVLTKCMKEICSQKTHMDLQILSR